MEDIAGWIAPIATMIAAMMTAANLGPRITGWGFVVFTVGSIAWSIVAIVTGQANLLWANGFLTIVNLVGIWRWLGREAKYGDGAQAAKDRSETRASPALFPIGEIAGRAVIGQGGETIGQAIGAMAECDGGRIAYLMVAEGGVGGVGERLHAIAWSDLRVRDAGFVVPLDAAGLAALPEVDAKAWPTRAEAIAA
ncbi:PRC-barrel domain-containing protein [Sphingomonas profundi]|uniref:PRC-barrel domain-containing protein n=1 Tax=Alterirhizorhabdus profundi TaxID=2681549 RepID=UPI0012E7756F|nr:PRC-barrel domain-containing protein [Sphingomonas profundi]